MSTFKNYLNTTIAEVTYEMPGDGVIVYDMIANPIITITYADGRKNRFDTNLIYKRGRDMGEKIANDKIKRKLGLN